MLKQGGKAKMMLHSLCGRFWVIEENTHQDTTTTDPSDMTCSRCIKRYERGQR